MPDLEYTIKTATELAGAEAAATQLEMQIGKAKALGKDYSELQAQLDRVNGSLKKLSPELQQLVGDEAKAGEGAGLLHQNHRAVHMLFSQMGAESVPGLGAALRGMMLGPLGPAIALAAAVGGVRKAFVDWSAQMDAQAQSNALPIFAEGIAAVKASFDGAAASVAALEYSLANIAIAQNTFANGLQRQLTLMKEIAAEQENERKAEEARQKAEIARQVAAGPAAGGLTPEQGALASTKIDVDAARAEHDAKRKAEQDALAAKEATLANEKIVQPKLTQTYDDLVNRQAELDAQRKKSEAYDPEKSRKIVQNNVGLNGLSETSSDVQGRNQQFAAALAELDKWSEEIKGWRTSPHADPAQKEQAEVAFAAAKGQLASLTKGFAQYDALHSHAQIAESEKLKTDIEEAKKKATENKTNAVTHEQEVEAERKRQGAVFPGEDKELAARIAAILSGALEKLYAQPHGKELLTGIDIANDIEKAIRAAGLADQYQRTHQISQEDAAFLMKFANEHGANATSADQSSAFVHNRYGNTGARENQPITPQNAGNLDITEQFLVGITKDLGGNAATVKQAADFMSQYTNNNEKFLEALTTMLLRAFSAQAQTLDKLEPRVAACEQFNNNH